MEQTHRSGAELKDARELAGLTQEQVAHALGRHRATIVAWEAKARVKAPKAAAFLRVVSELATPREAA
jgi:DNA-binding transcriptional regulator YiaG